MNIFYDICMIQNKMSKDLIISKDFKFERYYQLDTFDQQKLLKENPNYALKLLQEFKKTLSI